MKRGEGCVTIRRVVESGEERKMRAGPDEMDAHEQRHRHAKKNTEQCKPQILQADGLVIGAEDVAGEKTGLWLLRLICSAVVGNHAIRHS